MDMNKLIDENVILETLDMIYDKALNGVPKVSCSVDELADGRWTVRLWGSC